MRVVCVFAIHAW